MGSEGQLARDARVRAVSEEDFHRIREYLLQSEYLYPGIGEWWDQRVVPGYHSGDRQILVVQTSATIEGLFIGKSGERAKLCTLRLDEKLRARGIGRVLATEGLKRIIQRQTRGVHVTISEAADESVMPFFESIGFRRIGLVRDRYRRGVDEFVYFSPAESVHDLIQNRLLSGIDYTLFGAEPITLDAEKVILMSLKPDFAELMLSGRKTIEFRRRFSRRHVGASIVFYVSSPVCRFLFTARISQIEHRRKEDLWSEFGERGGVSKETFERYFGGTDNGYAIGVDHLATVPQTLDLREAQAVMPQWRPPQSFQTIRPDSPLLRALKVQPAY